MTFQARHGSQTRLDGIDLSAASDITLLRNLAVAYYTRASQLAELEDIRPADIKDYIVVMECANQAKKFQAVVVERKFDENNLM